MEVNRAVVEAAFIEQLEIGANPIGECTPAAAHDHRDEEEVVLVDEPGRNRLTGQLGAADADVAWRRGLQPANRFRVELPLDTRSGT